MKKVVFFIVLCFATSYSQVINIPDANFKARLLQALPTNTVAQNSTSGYIKIDINNDGEIEQSEALIVNYLNINNCNINNLEGLQYFTNLSSLLLTNNHFTSINISTLINLKSLDCSNNQLSLLDLSNLTNLESLFCINNLLYQLDFTYSPNLKFVDCDNNLLTYLDFSYNPLFEDLCCRNNPNLTSIKIRNSHHQLFGSQTMLNECWSGCPNLNYICADAFEIPALQSYLSGCGITQAITIDSACPLLGNEWFEVKEFSVSPNPSNGLFEITLPTLLKNATLSVYNLMGQRVYSTSMADGEVYSLDLSTLASGCYVLKISDGEQSYCKRILKE